MLPVARKDLERLRHAMQLLPRLIEPELPPRVARSLPHRPAFDDALTWLEVFGDAPDAVERWKHAKHQRAHQPHPPHPTRHAAGEHAAAAPADGRPAGRQTTTTTAQETRARRPFDGLRAGTRRIGRLYRMIQVAPMRTARPGASVTSGVRPTSMRLSNAFSRTNSQRMCGETRRPPADRLARPSRAGTDCGRRRTAATRRARRTDVMMPCGSSQSIVAEPDACGTCGSRLPSSAGSSESRKRRVGERARDAQPQLRRRPHFPVELETVRVRVAGVAALANDERAARDRDVRDRIVDDRPEPGRRQLPRSRPTCRSRCPPTSARSGSRSGFARVSTLPA